MKKKILLTGAAGFIGSNFVKKISLKKEVEGQYDFVIADALTYAGNYFSIQKDVENNAHLSFVKIDIRDKNAVLALFQKHCFDGVIHFAAESHVDRSITGPDIFVETNVLGTLNLLQAALGSFERNGKMRFLQIGTDEVYGTLKLDDPAFTEKHDLRPNSPYSSSKASADLFVKSYFETYQLPVLITRCSNNYGPYQHIEKLIPLMIDRACAELPLPVYGDGKNIRDWIHVDDHNEGVWKVYENGRIGEVYNLGGESERSNIEVVHIILDILKRKKTLINYVQDRKGHDFRYAMDISKVKNELGWAPIINFEDGLKQTIQWYQENSDWVNKLKDKECY